MTLVVTGHESATNALAFTLALLSKNPAAYERVIAEVDDVLGGRDPQAPDVDALPWTQAVVSEAFGFTRRRATSSATPRKTTTSLESQFPPATPSDSRHTFFTAIPNSGPTQRHSTRIDSFRAARPPVRAMPISRSAPVAVSAWARVWPSWN